MQTTLLGLAIAIILALVAALVAPLVVDWNHFRTTFENEASRLTGLSVRVIPAPSTGRFPRTLGARMIFPSRDCASKTAASFSPMPRRARA